METCWASQQYSPAWLPPSPCMKLYQGCILYLCLATPTHQTELLLHWRASRWGFSQEQGQNWHFEMPTEITKEPWNQAKALLPHPHPRPYGIWLSSKEKKLLQSAKHQNSISPSLRGERIGLVSGKQNDQQRDLESDKPGLKPRALVCPVWETPSPGTQFLVHSMGRGLGVHNVLQLHHGDCQQIKSTKHNSGKSFLKINC